MAYNENPSENRWIFFNQPLFYKSNRSLKVQILCGSEGYISCIFYFLACTAYNIAKYSNVKCNRETKNKFVLI